MRFRYVPFCLLFVVLGLPQSTDASLPKSSSLRIISPQEAWHIPLNPNSEIPIVQVRLNHRLTTVFAIDTSRFSTTIDPSLAQELCTKSCTMLQHLKVKHLTMTHIPIRVEPVTTRLYAASRGMTIRGVLGIDFLSQFKVTLDFPNQKMILKRPKRFPTLKFSSIQKAVHIPFQLLNGKAIVIQAQVNHAPPSPFTLHTTFVRSPLAGTRQLFHRGTVASTCENADQCTSFIVNKFSLGPKLVAYKQEAHLLPENDKRQGIIGQQFLKHLRIQLDFQRSILTVQF